jgi:hypothetical protein
MMRKIGAVFWMEIDGLGGEFVLLLVLRLGLIEVLGFKAMCLEIVGEGSFPSSIILSSISTDLSLALFY